MQPPDLVHSTFCKKINKYFTQPPSVQPRPVWGKSLLSLSPIEIKQPTNQPNIQLGLNQRDSFVLSPGGEDTWMPIHSEGIS